MISETVNVSIFEIDWKKVTCFQVVSSAVVDVDSYSSGTKR